LDQKELKEILDYDPETGLFTWKIARGRRTDLVGAVAGTRHKDGYIRIWIGYGYVAAHRLAFLWMEGQLPQHHVDHINRIRDDNSWRNLRACTRQENMQNMKKYSTNASGYVGVHFDKSHNKYRAQLRAYGKYVNIGRFSTAEQAAEARAKAKERLHTFHPKD